MENDLGKFNSLEQLIDAIDMGLDIEFYLYGIRYNISSRDKPFICVCPDGNAVFYENGTELVNNHKIDNKFLKDIWQDIGLRSM